MRFTYCYIVVVPVRSIPIVGSVFTAPELRARPELGVTDVTDPAPVPVAVISTTPVPPVGLNDIPVSYTHLTLPTKA